MAHKGCQSWAVKQRAAARPACFDESVAAMVEVVEIAVVLLRLGLVWVRQSLMIRLI